MKVSWLTRMAVAHILYLSRQLRSAGRLPAALAILVSLAGSATATVTIATADNWSDVFGGSTTTFHFTVSTDEAVRGRAGWSLSIDGRGVKRGETKIDLQPGENAAVEVKLEVPETKPGVILKSVLTLIVGQDGSTTALAKLEKPVWIFPANPFVDRTEWLKGLDIHLFDPDETTANRLKELEVPFTRTANIEALAEPGTGIVLIGEGISLADYRGLSEVMVKAAAAGHPVLCLAPKDGLFTLPGTADADLPAPSRMNLRQNDIITELDKRLDATSWPKAGPVVSGMTVKCDHDLVSGEITKLNGWPWFEAMYGEDQHRLAVSGFGLLDAWEASPTPRFLLARLLEYINGKPPATEENKN